MLFYFSQSRNDEVVPTTVIDGMTMQDCVSSNPSNSLLLGIECKQLDSQYQQWYCSDGTVQAVDPSRFDFGTFTVMVNCPGATNVPIGRLWIHCDFDFHEQIPISTWPLVQSGASLAGTMVTVSATAAAPLNGLTISNPAFGVKLNSSTTLLFPNMGTYLILAMYNGTGITSVPTITLGGNMSANPIFNNTIPGVGEFLAAGTTASIIWSFNVTTAGTAAANLITFGGAAGFAAGIVNLNAFQIPPVTAGYIGVEEKLNSLIRDISILRRDQRNQYQFNIDEKYQEEPDSPISIHEDPLILATIPDNNLNLRTGPLVPSASNLQNALEYIRTNVYTKK